MTLPNEDLLNFEDLFESVNHRLKNQIQILRQDVDKISDPIVRAFAYKRLHEVTEQYEQRLYTLENKED